jgi:beta-aspartyl-peptidase (threonine type)
MAMRTGGTGGVILVDRDGRLGLARNTRTMTWAAAGERLREIVAGA